MPMVFCIEKWEKSFVIAIDQMNHWCVRLYRFFPFLLTQFLNRLCQSNHTNQQMHRQHITYPQVWNLVNSSNLFWQRAVNFDDVYHEGNQVDRPKWMILDLFSFFAFLLNFFLHKYFHSKYHETHKSIQMDKINTFSRFSCVFRKLVKFALINN